VNEQVYRTELRRNSVQGQSHAHWIVGVHPQCHCSYAVLLGDPQTPGQQGQRRDGEIGARCRELRDERLAESMSCSREHRDEALGGALGARSAALEKSLACLVANPLVGVRVEDGAQRRLDLDLQRFAVGLAGSAAEGVDCVQSDLGDGVGQLRHDGLEIGLVREMVHELKTPPPHLCIGMLEPGDERGLHSRLDLNAAKVVRVDRSDELDDRAVSARGVGERIDQLRESTHDSFVARLDGPTDVCFRIEGTTRSQDALGNS
jgi:hypothetical protein